MRWKRASLLRVSKKHQTAFTAKRMVGKKEMTDPLTGKTVNAQLGNDHRLKTIYRVNMRSAYQKGQYERTMSSATFTPV
jgi:uncharacterized protein with gpF-like domain